jgi:hypothetical protein
MFSKEQMNAAVQVAMNARDQATEQAINLAIKLADVEAKLAEAQGKLKVSTEAVEALSARPAPATV